jgi:hypothetical protein
LKHHIPAYLLPYFLSPEYPRIEKETFNRNEPAVEGVCLLTEQYTLGSVNRSNMWKQRRPFLAYWGTPQQPSYLQLRFLHDDYDFCAANYYSRQNENKILATLTFSTNGGDKHVRNDDLVNGVFQARDLRLRFEFGNVKIEDLKTPAAIHQAVSFQIQNISFTLQLFYASFGDYRGHWEKGGDGTVSWIDYVLYSGEETTIRLPEMNSAALGFVFSMGETVSADTVSFSEQAGVLSVQWEEMELVTPVKPKEKEENL